MTRCTLRFARWAALVTASAATLLLAACGGGSPPSEPDGPPAAPTNVTTTAGANFVVVRWDHDGERVSGFEITRGALAADGALASQQAETFAVGPDERSFADTGLTPGASYAYQVAATGPDGASDPAPADGGDGQVAIEAGTQMLVGTNDRRWNDAGTVFVVYYAFDEAIAGDSSLVFENRIDGPPGWNDDQPHEWTADETSSARTNGWSFLNLNSVPPVNGTYTHTLTITGAAEDEVHVHDVAFADADFRLGPAEDVAFSDVSSSGLTAAWTSPPGTVMTVVTLFDQDGAILVREGTHEDAFTFEDQVLDDGVYEVEIAPFNFDLLEFPLPADPIGLSYRFRTVAVGGVLSPLCASSTDAVDVPDPELESILRDELRVPVGDGPLTCADLARLEELDAEGAGIVDLGGLEYAVNARFLDLGGNAIADLSPLSGLDDLWYLEIDGPDQAFPDLSPIAGLTGLGELSVNEVSLGDEQIWPYVATLTGLISLDVQDTPVSDASALSALTGLEELQLSGTDVTSVTFVEDLPDLRALWISWSGVADISPVYGLTALEELAISGLGIDDIGFAADMTDLAVLIMSDCSVTDFAPLATLTALRHLEVSGCGLTDVSFLSDLVPLEVLEVSDNAIEDFGPIVTMTQLVELDIGGTGLSDIGFLEDFVELELLGLADNEITGIGPLVANVGLGDGDDVSIEWNLLDLDDPEVAADIQALLDRGVELEYESQKSLP